MLIPLFLVFLLVAPAACVYSPREARTKRSSNIVPGKYIVEFESDGQQGGFAAQLANSFLDFVEKSTDYTAKAYIHYDNPKIFTGVAVDVNPKTGTTQQQQNGAATNSEAHNPSAVLSQLRIAPKVRNVWPSRYVYLNAPTGRFSSRSPAPTAGPYDVQDSMSSSFYERAAAAAAKTQQNDTAPPTAAPRTAHVLIGVSIQHDRGNFGAGVKACVIDTPADYSHPGFNDGRPAGTPCTGPDCRFEGGYDWFGPNTKGDNFVPGPLTLDAVRQHPLQCGHGTHTSGLMAAKDSRYPGVASEAKLRNYAVIECLNQLPDATGAQSDAVFLDAILKAAEDGCDVINVSLGEASWPNGPLPVAASRAAYQGHTFVMSAGNGGDYGMQVEAAPSCGEGVISVGAGSDDVFPQNVLSLSSPLQDGSTNITIFGMTLWNLNFTSDPLELFFVANETNPDLPQNGCLPIKTTEDLSNRILVLGPIDCKYKVQDDNTLHLKPRAILWAADDVDLVEGQGDNEPKEGSILTADLKKLYAAWKQNAKLTVTVQPSADPLQFYTIPNPKKGQLQHYSSPGPAEDGTLKPDIIAPGSKITATYPLPNLYANLGGTSMSSPIAAGAVVLLKAAKGKDIPLDAIRQRLVQGAQPIKAVGSDKLLSAYYQGGGMINITTSIDMTTLVEPYRISLGDSAARKRQPELSILVTNVGQGDQSYTLSSVAAQSLLALRDSQGRIAGDTDVPWLNKPEPASAEATLDFEPAKFSLAARGTQKVTITLHAPDDNPRLLAFSGYILVQSNQAEGTASVPYAGFAGVFSDVPVLGTAISNGTKEDPAYQIPGLYNSSTGELIRDDGRSVPLDLGENSTLSVNFTLAVPTEAAYCDLVAANITYTASVPMDLFPDSPIGQNRDLKLKFDDVPVALRLSNDTFLDRDGSAESIQITSDGIDAKTKQKASLPAGDYRVLLRAHRWLLEDYVLDSSYDSYLSHSFKYVPSNNTT